MLTLGIGGGGGVFECFPLRKFYLMLRMPHPKSSAGLLTCYVLGLEVLGVLESLPLPAAHTDDANLETAVKFSKNGCVGRSLRSFSVPHRFRVRSYRTELPGRDPFHHSIPLHLFLSSRSFNHQGFGAFEYHFLSLILNNAFFVVLD